MSNISKVRTLSGDPILYGKTILTGDGVSVRFQVLNFPIYPDTENVDDGGSPSPEYTMDDSVGLITFTAAPANTESVTVTYKHSLLTDAEIQDFLDLEDDDVKLAAADALDSIASSQALIQKKIKVLDLQTDGPALADALHRLAADYRKQVLDADMQGADFDYAEQINDAPGFYEKVIKDWMREG